MSLSDSIHVAFESLLANRLRTLLTMLGIVIGVGSVIALMAVGQGSQQIVEQGILGLGSNLLFVRPGSSSQSGVQQGAGSAQTLTGDDASAIAQDVSDIVAAAPQLTTPLQLSANGQNMFAQILGVTPDYPSVLNLNVADGAFFTQNDLDARARTIVLGASLASTLFPNGSPVGSQVRLGIGRNIVVTATVAGVLAPKGGNTSSSQDSQAFMPLTTVQNQVSAQRRTGTTSTVNQITIQVDHKDQIPAVKLAITDLLLQRHNVATADFTVESQDDLATAANQANAALTVLLGAIAGISLVVGGIGIMNIMLVSVMERTREIGIRKAVGASRNDILMQFLTEAIVVSATGGVLGILAGIGAARFMDGRTIAGLGSNVQTVVPWSAVVAAFVVATAIGIFFGLYPASRAANLRPIEALHYE